MPLPNITSGRPMVGITTRAATANHGSTHHRSQMLPRIMNGSWITFSRVRLKDCITVVVSLVTRDRRSPMRLPEKNRSERETRCLVTSSLRSSTTRVDNMREP